jgi:hypothetical protein
VKSMSRKREIAMFARMNGASARFYNPYGGKVVQIPIKKAFKMRALYGANPKYPEDVEYYMRPDNIVDDGRQHRAMTPKGYVNALTGAIKDPEAKVPAIPATKRLFEQGILGEGKHRIAASRIAGLKTVPVVVIDKYPDEVSPLPLLDEGERSGLVGKARKSSSLWEFGAALGDKTALENPGGSAAVDEHGSNEWEEDNQDRNIFWHGSPSGDLRGGMTGVHLGTKKAAEEALEARIGVPKEGSWDGTREYGKTLLAGKKSIIAMGKYVSGVNCDAPEEDYYADKLPPEQLKYANGELMPLNVRPEIFPYKVVGRMSNVKRSSSNVRFDKSGHYAGDDFQTNSKMGRLLKSGKADKGFYYKNVGEDEGSTSVVVPNSSFVKRIYTKKEIEDAWKEAHR